MANPDASLKAIEAQMRQHGITRTILLASYFPQEGSGISNFRALYWLRDRPQFSLFGSLDIETYFYQGCNELTELAEAGLIKGIKLYTAYQEIDVSSEKFKTIARLARKHHLPIMLHGGASTTLWKKWGRDKVMALTAGPRKNPGAGFTTPETAAQAAASFPDVRFIVSHLCKPFFDEMIHALNRYANLLTDTSGLMDSKQDAAHKPACMEQVRRFVGECGPEKILFGTDFPVQSHADSIDIIEGAMADFTLEDRHKIYFGNADRLIFQKSV